MKRIISSFSSVKMTWTKVIILALAGGVITAVLKLIPALQYTSFQDPAVNIEFWFLPAVFIIVNCEKWWEASLKTFIFFVISQPLIYLIQVPFSGMGFGLFTYYKYWLVITFFTLPGAAIAFLVKKKNRLSAAVLSVATGTLGYMAGIYFRSCSVDFPHHLLSILFCLGVSVFFAVALLDDRKKQLAVVAVTVIVLAASLLMNRPVKTDTVSLPAGNWSYEISDPSVIDVYEAEDGENSYVIEAKTQGIAFVVFTDDNGNAREYCATITSGGMYVGEVD